MEKNKKKLIDLASAILKENTIISDCYDFKDLYLAKEIIAAEDSKSQATAKFLAKAVFAEYGYSPKIRNVDYDLCENEEIDFSEQFAKEVFVPGSVMICSAKVSKKLSYTKDVCPSPEKFCIIENFWSDVIAENIDVPFCAPAYYGATSAQVDTSFICGKKQIKEVDKIVLCLSEFESAQYGAHIYHEHSRIYNYSPEIVICNDLKGRSSEKQTKFINKKMDKILRKLFVKEEDIRWSSLNPQQFSADTVEFVTMIISQRKSYYKKTIYNQHVSFYVMPENCAVIMPEMTNLSLFNYLHDVNILAGQLHSQNAYDFKMLYELWDNEGVSNHTRFWENVMAKIGISICTLIIVADGKRAIKACYPFEY